MQYTQNVFCFFFQKKQLKISLENFDFFIYPLKHTFEAVLTSTHNLNIIMFGIKIRKISIPLQTLILLYKSGV